MSETQAPYISESIQPAPTSNGGQTLDRPQLKKLVEAEAQARLTKCSQDLQQVLAAHGCELVALPQIDSEGRIVAMVTLRVLK